MNRSITTLALTLLFLTACATGPRIESMQAPGVTVGEYQRFAFIEPLGTDRAGYASLISQQLKFSTRRELEERGLTFVPDMQDADLLVNFHAHLDDRIRTREVPDPFRGPTFWDYRAGFYTPWPAYQTRTEITQYTVGTLVIDLVDAKRSELIWEATARNTVTERTRRDAARLIDETVTKMFLELP